jgi:hypothetical protein
MMYPIRKFGLWLILPAACVLLSQSSSLSDTSSREGCMNQWLFNGVWRVRVTAVEPYSVGGPQVGWQVTEVWRNGTFRELSPTNSSIKGQRLELANGAIDADSLSQQNVTINNFPPAGEFTYKQIFMGSNFDPSNKPKGLLITFDNAQLSQQKQWPQFTNSKYDFQFNLGCVATGAAAQAEGGSTQLPAQAGCMNQWMSNGIWKMRVTTVGTVPAVLSNPSAQTGWLVTQTWTDVSGRGIRGDGGQDYGTKYVGTNATDEFLTTQSGRTGSSANVSFGFQLRAKPPRNDWDPGESWTLKQYFSWGSLDPSDKPVRLLVDFDDKTQNAIAGWPHYRKPADFRIDLTCAK